MSHISSMACPAFRSARCVIPELHIVETVIYTHIFCQIKYNILNMPESNGLCSQMMYAQKQDGFQSSPEANLDFHLIGSLDPSLFTNTSGAQTAECPAALFYLMERLLLWALALFHLNPSEYWTPLRRKNKETKALVKFILLPNSLPFQKLQSQSIGTLVRITFLSLSISGMVSKSLSSTELSVSEWHGCPPSEEDICLPGLELDSSETENSSAFKSQEQSMESIPLQKARCLLSLEKTVLVQFNSLPTRLAPWLPSQAHSVHPFLPLTCLFLGPTIKNKRHLLCRYPDAKITLCLYIMFHILRYEHRCMSMHMQGYLQLLSCMWVNTHISNCCTFLTDYLFREIPHMPFLSLHNENSILGKGVFCSRE